VVSLGGNLALNVGPQPDGRLPAGAVRTLRGLGEWLKVNGEAIYGTRVQAPYKVGDTRFTQKGGNAYAIQLYPDDRPEPERVSIHWPEPSGAVRLLETGAPCAFERRGEMLEITLPAGIAGKNAPLARVFTLENKDGNTP
jgi:alpha-L-fucosidase